MKKIALGVAALLLVFACSKTPERTPEKTAATAARSMISATAEDWCEEHGVRESLCTRCNPSLVAAFKATGDWCKEHDLPESQCLKCNPNLKIERPTKSER